MRFASLALVLLLTFVASAAAQTSFGLRAGLSVADITGFPGEGAIDETPRLGATGTVFARVPVANGFQIQPEVAYVPRGLERRLPDPLEGKGGGSVVGQRFEVEYLDAALLGRIEIPAGRTASAGVVLGPALAVKLGEAVTQETDDGVESEVEFEGGYFEGTDLGLVMGADFGSGPFFVDARYTFGVTNVFNGESLNPTGGVTIQDLQHGVFSATFGVRLGG